MSAAERGAMVPALTHGSRRPIKARVWGSCRSPSSSCSSRLSHVMASARRTRHLQQHKRVRRQGDRMPVMRNPKPEEEEMSVPPHEQQQQVAGTNITHAGTAGSVAPSALDLSAERLGHGTTHTTPGTRNRQVRQREQPAGLATPHLSNSPESVTAAWNSATRRASAGTFLPVKALTASTCGLQPWYLRGTNAVQGVITRRARPCLLHRPEIK
jgi:hypothetical protein